MGTAWRGQPSCFEVAVLFNIKASGVCLHVLAGLVLSWGAFAQREPVWKPNPTQH